MTSRTIKFRGKAVKTDKWLFGDYINNRGLDFIAPREFVPEDTSWQDLQVNPATVGQFTGVLDSAGSEIYEGDIITYNTHRMGRKSDYPDRKVVWDDTEHRWATERDGVLCELGINEQSFGTVVFS